MHKDIERILFSEEQIKQRVEEIGQSLTDEYRDVASSEGILLFSILRGAFVFMADLARATKLPVEIDFMALSSYGSHARSSGEVVIQKDIIGSIRGKHVIAVEDVLDSGRTLQYLQRIIEMREPASFSVVTLLHKKVENQVDIQCKHIGFECPNEFIVGYGLDYAQRYRNLPYIGVLKPEVYEER